MRRLPDYSLTPATIATLDGKQNDIDAYSTYRERREKAKEVWKSVSKSTKAFKEIKSTLDKMCPGIRRCAYCEDSAPDEIEHIQPKDFYPELTFRWENYLYACGPCNGPKNNQYALWDAVTQQELLLEKEWNDKDIPPPSWPHLLFNPRRESAIDFMEMDFESGEYVASDDCDDFSNKRCEYTLSVLKLNERTHLPKARLKTYRDYRARLKEYVSEKKNGAQPSRLSQLENDFIKDGLLSVWYLMKKAADYHPELKPLFAAAPEALNW